MRYGVPHSKANGTGVTVFGEVHCVPCLVTNLVLLVVASALVALVSPFGGVAFGVLGLVVILVKGYLVPYTPVFAPRLVSALPTNRFERDGRTSDSLEYRNADTGEELTEALLRARIVASDGEELRLAADFESRWSDRIDSLRAGSAAEVGRRLTDAIPGATEAAVETVNGNTYVVLSNGSGDLEQESWLSPATAIAEAASAELLRETTLAPDRRAEAAHLLTMFVQSCPACGSEVVEEPAGGCCGPPQLGPDGDPLLALVCENCSSQLFTFEP